MLSLPREIVQRVCMYCAPADRRALLDAHRVFACAYNQEKSHAIPINHGNAVIKFANMGRIMSRVRMYKPRLRSVTLDFKGSVDQEQEVLRLERGVFDGCGVDISFGCVTVGCLSVFVALRDALVAIDTVYAYLAPMLPPHEAAAMLDLLEPTHGYMIDVTNRDHLPLFNSPVAPAFMRRVTRVAFVFGVYAVGMLEPELRIDLRHVPDNAKYVAIHSSTVNMSIGFAHKLTHFELTSAGSFVTMPPLVRSMCEARACEVLYITPNPSYMHMESYIYRQIMDVLPTNSTTHYFVGTNREPYFDAPTVPMVRYMLVEKRIRHITMSYTSWDTHATAELVRMYTDPVRVQASLHQGHQAYVADREMPLSPCGVYNMLSPAARLQWWFAAALHNVSTVSED